MNVCLCLTSSGCLNFLNNLCRTSRCISSYVLKNWVTPCSASALVFHLPSFQIFFETRIFWLAHLLQITFISTFIPPTPPLPLWSPGGHTLAKHPLGFSPNSQPSTLQYILTFSPVITFSDVSQEGKRSYGLEEYRSFMCTNTHTHTAGLWTPLVLQVDPCLPLQDSHHVTSSLLSQHMHTCEQTHRRQKHRFLLN